MIYIKNVHGVKLIYRFSRLGWSYQVSGFKDRKTMRNAIIHLYPKHCPPIPDHLVQSVIDENMRLLEVTRSTKTLA